MRQKARISVDSLISSNIEGKWKIVQIRIASCWWINSSIMSWWEGRLMSWVG